MIVKKNSNDPLDNWDEFADRARQRLRQGRQIYGERSFSREPDELFNEIEEELLDTAAWSYILIERLKKVRDKLSRQG